MSEKHTLLCFLYSFPPNPGTAAMRNYNQAKELSTYFKKSFILTNAAKASSFQLEKAEIISIDSLDYRNLYVRYKSGFREQLKNNFFSQFLIRSINTFPCNLIFGEGGGYYLIKAYLKALKIIKSEKVTHIYSAYRPFTDHFIAYLLKRKFPNIIWIADFRDLIVDPHYHQQFLPEMHQKVYSRIFSRANVLTTVSEGLAEKLYEYNSNVITLRNGIEPENIQNIACESSYFTMVYTGNMFMEERNATPLFAVLKDLIHEGIIDMNKIQIIYAGKDEIKWRKYANEYDLKNQLIYMGIVDQAQALKLQNDANINILLTISSPELRGVLTGKFVEYITAGSPILCIVKNENDPFIQQELTQLNAGISVSDRPEDQDKIKDFIIENYNYWLQTGKNKKEMIVSGIKNKFDKTTIFKPLIEII